MVPTCTVVSRGFQSDGPKFVKSLSKKKKQTQFPDKFHFFDKTFDNLRSPLIRTPKNILGTNFGQIWGLVLF